MLSRKILGLVGALSLVAITQTGCKKDENKGSTTQQKKQESPTSTGEGTNDSNAKTSGSSGISSTPPASVTQKEIELSELPKGYYEITGIRYYSTRNPKVSFEIKISYPGRIYQGDPVKISKEGEAQASAQIPFFIEANDDSINFHDFIVFVSSFKGGRSPEWKWNTLVGTLTANQILTGFPELGVKYEFEGKFKSHKITITDTTLTITAESPDITLQAHYRLNPELKNRPEAMATYNKKDKKLDTVSPFSGLYMPIFKHKSSHPPDFSDYPSAFRTQVKEKEYKDKYMYTLREFGMWIKGTLQTSTYPDGTTQIRNTLTWTTELMKWHQKNSPKRKDQIVSALQDYKAYVQILKLADTLEARMDSIALYNAYIAMINEAIQAIEQDRHPGKPGPWDLVSS